jgi:hypothetical protein
MGNQDVPLQIIYLQTIFIQTIVCNVRRYRLFLGQRGESPMSNGSGKGGHATKEGKGTTKTKPKDRPAK